MFVPSLPAKLQTGCSVMWGKQTPVQSSPHCPADSTAPLHRRVTGDFLFLFGSNRVIEFVAIPTSKPKSNRNYSIRYTRRSDRESRVYKEIDVFFFIIVILEFSTDFKKGRGSQHGRPEERWVISLPGLFNIHVIDIFFIFNIFYLYMYV